jgi:hypothetical protein
MISVPGIHDRRRITDPDLSGMRVYLGEQVIISPGLLCPKCRKGFKRESKK